MTPLKNKILQSLSENKVTMIPRWKFVLYTFLAFFGIAFSFALSVFIFSLALFLMSRYGMLDVSFFELLGSLHALRSTPLILLISTTMLLIIIELLSLRYTFAFRRPLGITLLGLTISATGISYIISETDAHEFIRDYSKMHNMDQMVRLYDRPLPNSGYSVIKGEVVAIGSTTVSIKQFDGVTILVYGSSTRAKLVTPGDMVVVLGNYKGDQFHMVSMKPSRHARFGGSNESRNTRIKNMPKDLK